MANRLKRGADRLASRMASTSSETVVYVRGSTTASVAAVIAQRTFRVPEAYGMYRLIQLRDFIVTESALTAFGEPQEGDEIRETGGDSVVRVYRVVAPSEMDHHWEWSDLHHNSYRIHTKYIKDHA